MTLSRHSLAIALAAASLLIAGQAMASSCDLPDPPGCARDSGRFDDANDFEDCRREMGRYRSQVQNSLACIRDEFAQTSFRYDNRARMGAPFPR